MKLPPAQSFEPRMMKFHHFFPPALRTWKLNGAGLPWRFGQFGLPFSWWISVRTGSGALDCAFGERLIEKHHQNVAPLDMKTASLGSPQPRRWTRTFFESP